VPPSLPLEPGGQRRKGPFNHYRTVRRLAWLAALPGLLATALLLWLGDVSSKGVITVAVFVGAGWLFFHVALMEAVFRPMQAASNMLSALREGDYSLKPRDADPEDPLGQIMLEVGELTTTLRKNRLGVVEANLLLRQVMEEIDVGVMTFDSRRVLRLVNPAAEALLASTGESLVGQPVEVLPEAVGLMLDPAFDGEVQLPGRPGRWGWRTGSFRAQGEPHTLLMVTDLSRRLRDEERQAWKRLIRVMGHEINNSLAPIKSIAGSMRGILRRDPLPDDWQQDLSDGLTVIEERTQALATFIEAYASIARLPPPRLQPTDLAGVVHRVTTLHPGEHCPVRTEAGPDATLQADEGQLEQLLINLLKNACEAAAQTEGAVSIRWTTELDWLRLDIEDEGPGIANPDNLFVPFFSTKPGGSGIGLTLSRQIAEAHGGNLELVNRSDRSGARATLRLPLARSSSTDG
jgi:nitrogen fixation/metabolism regulation signal transduction histidine kinase